MLVTLSRDFYVHLKCLGTLSTDPTDSQVAMSR